MSETHQQWCIKFIPITKLATDSTGQTVVFGRESDAYKWLEQFQFGEVRPIVVRWNPYLQAPVRE